MAQASGALSDYEAYLAATGHGQLRNAGLSDYGRLQALICAAAEAARAFGERVLFPLLEGQGESGGWVYRYAPTNGGDNSVGYWQIQAMKACKHTGLWDTGMFRKPAKKALEWLERSESPSGGARPSGNLTIAGGPWPGRPRRRGTRSLW